MAEGAAISKGALNEAILLLTQAFQGDSTSHKKIEKAIEILNRSVLMRKEVELVRGDRVQQLAPGDYYKLGVPWFDSWTGGLRKQEIVLFSGIPYVGKTHLLAYCGGNGLLEGANVLHIVGEDLLSDIQGMYHHIVGAKNPAMKNLYFLSMMDSIFGVREIEAGIVKFKNDAGVEPDITVIDNLDLLHTSAYKPDWEGVTELCRDLKLLAKRQDLIIITSSLQNFGREQRGMSRLARAKTGKAANMDVLIMIDEAIGQEYNMGLWKRRGKKITEEMKQKLIRCDWDSMITEEIL